MALCRQMSCDLISTGTPTRTELSHKRFEESYSWLSSWGFTSGQSAYESSSRRWSRSSRGSH